MSDQPSERSSERPSERPSEQPSEPVAYEVDDGLATITMQRPGALNAMDRSLKEGLLGAVGSAATDDAVRAVLLVGTGRAFSVGQDLGEHAQALAERPLEEVWSTVERHFTPVATALATMPKPTVAGVNGVAAGAGASLAFCCDLRVLSDRAGFNLAFAGIGLSCDTGASWTLPRLVGRATALDLLLRPRTVDAAEAERLGLASLVVPDDDLLAEATALARGLAQGPTVAYAAIRDSVTYAGSHGLADALAFEATQMARTGATQDHRDAVAAFVAKQRPVFRGR